MIKRLKKEKQKIDINSLSEKELKDLIIRIAKKLGLEFKNKSNN